MSQQEIPETMRLKMLKFHPRATGFIGFLIALVGLVGPLGAQNDPLELVISRGDVKGRFVVNGDVTYTLSSGIVGLKVFGGETGQGSDNPLFCFDFSSEPHTVNLKIDGESSAVTTGTRVLANELGLTSALQYQLSAKTISISPASDVACFFRSYNDLSQSLESEFGLYGVAPPSTSTPSAPPQGVIFSDNFSALARLDVGFEGDGTANNDGTVSYSILLTNRSVFDISSLALQQSIPYGVDVTIDSCTVNGNVSSICQNTDEDTLRFVGFTLAAGATLEIEITASRNANWPTASPPITALPIYLAAATPTLSNIVYDVAELTLAPEPASP